MGKIRRQANEENGRGEVVALFDAALIETPDWKVVGNESEIVEDHSIDAG